MHELTARVVADADVIELAAVVAQLGQRHARDPKIDRLARDVAARVLGVAARFAIAADDVDLASAEVIRDLREQPDQTRVGFLAALRRF